MQAKVSRFTAAVTLAAITMAVGLAVLAVAPVSDSLRGAFVTALFLVAILVGIRSYRGASH